MDHQETLMEFPCRFPIKAMTRAGEDAVGQVIKAVERHTGPLPRDAITLRASSKGNYTGVTIVIEAESREQLDAIYRELTGLEVVEVAL